MKQPHSQRGHADLPPSSSDKWMRCGGWLKTVGAYREQFGRKASSPAAEEGTRAHERFEELLSTLPAYTGPSRTVTELFDHEFDEELAPMFEWVADQPGDLYSEIRVDFGESLGYVGLMGTVDVVLVEPDRLTIPDLKFGRGVVEAVENPQLMCYLWGAVQRFGPRPSYRIAILQPRAWHPEGPIRVHGVTDAELTVFAFDLEEAIRANYEGADPTPGPHCRNYCEALGVCRAAKQESLRRLMLEEDDA